MNKPYENDPATIFIAQQIKALSHRKSQADIATQAGFSNANMMTMLKQGKNKIPLDRVPSLASALECDPAYLMRLAMQQSVGATAARAIIDILREPISNNERSILAEVRDVTCDTDPRLTAKSRNALRQVFAK
ncbi:transcriptional regulator [Marivivens niveibacter]|uniref:Transcriptional regulator n=1 Tax=Marivivens niveibacter TaxID=1930667 RepID=A0A251WXQ7_9RHOB|nr:helix-turn-helix domain-containing protein [Marivivens niveibacter]OUD08925.1 transcriptional regulator [Marivivens niveibacter]